MMLIMYSTETQQVSVEYDGHCRWYPVWHLARLGFVPDAVLGQALVNPDTFIRAEVRP